MNYDLICAHINARLVVPLHKQKQSIKNVTVITNTGAIISLPHFSVFRLFEVYCVFGTMYVIGLTDNLLIKIALM